MTTDALSIAQRSLRGIRGVYPDAVLRRDKTGAVINVEAMVNDSGSATVYSPSRPFPGDILSQSGHEWVVAEVAGWGDAELWNLTLGETQPEQDGLPAPTVTLRRMGTILRIDFPDGQADDIVAASVFTADGAQVGLAEYRNTLTDADKQLVVDPVADGYSVEVWYTRPPRYRKSENLRVEVPDAS